MPGTRVLNIVYLLVLAIYFIKPGNELCTSTEIIDTLEECLNASKNLGLTFKSARSTPNFPKGCWAFDGGPKSYWNTHTSGGTKQQGHPICKTGESI